MSNCLHFCLFIENNQECGPEKQGVAVCLTSLRLYLCSQSRSMTQIYWADIGLVFSLEKGRHWDQIGDTSPCSPTGVSAWIFFVSAGNAGLSFFSRSNFL